MGLYPEYMPRVAALKRRIGTEIQKILAVRSTDPVALAAKLHLALRFSDAEEVGSHSSLFLASALRDLLPLLPPDMAAFLEPLALERAGTAASGMPQCDD